MDKTKKLNLLIPGWGWELGSGLKILEIRNLVEFCIIINTV